jgi:hypothetical protein
MLRKFESKQFFLVALGGLLLAGLIVAIVSGVSKLRVHTLVSHTTVESKADSDASIELGSPKLTVAAKPEHASSSAGASIYLDQSRSLADRFGLLYQQALAGDHNAMHLAYQIELDCVAWSKGQFLKPTPEMESVKSALLAKCANISSQPGFALLSKVAEEQPRDFFEQGIRDEIRTGFANEGAAKAMSIALDDYRARPDPATAKVIAETLAEMDVTKYDIAFKLEGLSASDPNYRRSMFETALNFLSCDYGVPCGPDSEIVASVCVNGGICHPGYGLEQLYREILLSGEDMKNLESILAALRKKG